MADYKFVGPTDENGVIKYAVDEEITTPEGPVIIHHPRIQIPKALGNRHWKEYLQYVDNGGETDPWKTTEELKQDKIDELAEYRWEMETGGIEVSGAMIKTDRESQALITGAYNAVQLNPSLIIDWKTSTGFVQLNKEAIESIAIAVSNHIQSCFTREKELLVMIDSDPELDIPSTW